MDSHTLGFELASSDEVMADFLDDERQEHDRRVMNAIAHLIASLTLPKDHRLTFSDGIVLIFCRNLTCVSVGVDPKTCKADLDRKLYQVSVVDRNGKPITREYTDTLDCIWIWDDDIHYLPFQPLEQVQAILDWAVEYDKEQRGDPE